MITCENCEFWKRYKPRSGKEGQCHLKSPQVFQTTTNLQFESAKPPIIVTDGTITRFPVTCEDQGCGEGRRKQKTAYHTGGGTLRKE